MFRGPFDHSNADGEASTVGEELALTSNAQEARPTTRPTEQTIPDLTATASHDPPSQVAEGITRPLLSDRRVWSHSLTNLPPQTMSDQETKDARNNLMQEAPQSIYLASPAAHTIQPFLPTQLNHTFPDPWPPKALPKPTPTSNHTAIVRPVLLPCCPPILTTEGFETLLQPVQAELNRLKGTKMPPEDSRVQAKSTMQVLKERLLPVGRYVVQRCAGMEGVRGVEVRVCRYIAENYWPHELVQVDGLRVMEMYRNAVYLERVEWERGVEEEEVWEPDMSGIADVDGDVEEDMPGLVDEDMWKPKVAEEVWKPVAVGEKAWEPEIGGTDEQDEESGVGGVDSTDDGSWEALVRWIGDKSKGG